MRRARHAHADPPRTRSLEPTEMLRVFRGTAGLFGLLGVWHDVPGGHRLRPGTATATAERIPLPP